MEKIDIGSIWFKLDCGFIDDLDIQMMLRDDSLYVVIYIVVIDLIYKNKGILNKSHYPVIASKSLCNVNKVKHVVEDTGLFFFDGVEFSSERARKDMLERKKMSDGGKKPFKPKN